MRKRSRMPKLPHEMMDLWGGGLDYTTEEEKELQELEPADELWPFPEPLPPEIEAEMPGEEEVGIIFEEYYGSNPPDGWSREKARTMVNVGRKRMWRLWKEKGR